jgi:Sulfotransferase domain
MPVGIHSLGRYPLSLILCHLQEVEGTSLLITCKRFANHVLPLFRLKRQDLIKVRAKHRHQFLEYPAQDPEVLLQRLNTHRLRKRLLLKSSQQSYEINKTTGELALSEPVNQKWPAHLELLRFLTRADQTHGTSLLVSYPRSGNTLLRNLLERLSGIVTGSDNRPDRKLSRDLATKHNLVGEGVISNRNVHIVKTHYPERTGSRISDARRAILLVRNPYDAIDSYWNLNLTNTHTETVTDNVYAKHQDTFDDLASNEMKVWSQFHRYWLEAQIPVLVVRFEDLITNLNGELSRIARFLLMDSKRVSHASDTSGQQELGSYRPRMTGTRPFGKSLEKGRYSDNIIDKFHAIATQQPGWRGQTLLQYFGYDILTQDFPNNFWNQTVTPIDAEPVGGTEKSMEINAGYELRAKNDAYGRSMKQWRLDHTNNDQDPFPIVPR